MIRCLAELAPGLDLRVEEAGEAINRSTHSFVSVSIAVKVAAFSSLKSSYAGVHNYCSSSLASAPKATRFGLESRCVIGLLGAYPHRAFIDG